MTRTLNFKSVLAALLLTCFAQGAFAQSFWSETFSDKATSIANWVHSGTNGGPKTWQWTNNPTAGDFLPAAFASATASTGYMYFDSDSNGNFAHDVRLTGVGVPANCTGKSNVRLKFFTYLRSFSGTEVCRVGISTDGTNFTYYNLAQLDALVAQGAGTNIYQGPIDIAIPQADNQAQVWIQFRYQGTFEYYWKVDDVELYEEEVAVPCDLNPSAIICDNLDSYNTAQKLGPQATWWTTWSGTEGGTEDGTVSTEQASTAPNSLKILSTATNGGPQDVLLALQNKSTGKYELKFKIYIPAGKNAYYNVQQAVPLVGGNGDWNLNVFFNNAGAGQFTDGDNVELAKFTYANDKWLECKHVFDLDNNLVTFWVDGNFVKKAAYERNLGGINFYGTNNVSTFYVDDVEYVELPAVVYNTDECDGAEDISLLFGQAPNVAQTSGLYDNTTATVGASDPAPPGCFLDDISTSNPNGIPAIDNSMWFTFTGDGGTYDIQTVPCNSTSYVDDTQMAIYTGECGSLLPIACNEDLFADNDPLTDFRAGFLNFETEAGTDYYILIDGWSAGGVAAVGEYCIEILQKPSITCAQGAVGTFNLSNNGIVCNGGNPSEVLTLNDASFTLPTEGPVFGMTWAITTQPVTGGVWPPTLTTSYWGSFFVNPSLFVPTLVNDGDPLNQNGTWYFTPVVVAGAIDTIPADPAALHHLDISNGCFFVGQSAPITLLAELTPLDATVDVTSPTSGNSDGAIDLTVTGGFFDIIQDPALSYTVEWTGPNGFTSTDEDIAGLEAGTYNATITDLTGCADPYDITVDLTTAVKDPASVKLLSVNPNPTADFTTLNLSLQNAADVRIEVVNTLGQTLQTLDAGKVNALNQRIDLTRFTNGTYFLRLTIDGETAMRRVVVNR